MTLDEQIAAVRQERNKLSAEVQELKGHLEAVHAERDRLILQRDSAMAQERARSRRAMTTHEGLLAFCKSRDSEWDMAGEMACRLAQGYLALSAKLDELEETNRQLFKDLQAVRARLKRAVEAGVIDYPIKGGVSLSPLFDTLPVTRRFDL